ncbi:diguanylate cyclase [Ectobacillus polymachus]|uniref:diguanylate cyclase n=1 Tax=Ectobacillus polymachus TaxID=1508806 RepID=UPI003A88A9C3
MDSAIFIATCYMFGLSFTLNILLFSSVLFMVIYKKIAWWKHLLNFAVYNFMLIGFYYTFIGLGGNIGKPPFDYNFYPFLFSIFIYCLINIVILSIYLKLISKDNYLSILYTMLKEGISLYVVTILLSVILIILVQNELILGYLLLICVLLLLSFAFRKHFELYLKTSEKANKDFLTGLSNHAYFKDVLEEKVKEASSSNQPLSLALLDIDDFKKYNDFYGHIQGDSLLKFFGAFLETECNKHGYFVARYGGEEFTILMQNTPVKQAAMFMDRLRKKVNDSYFDGVERLPYHCLSFSAGISEYKKELYDSQELLNRADQAMYSAKEQGKNMIRIADEEYSMQKTLSFEKELNEAEQQLNIFLSKDVYTYRHSKRVYQYAVDFSEELKLSDAERKTFILGSLVHDIGKLEIPRDIINKKGKLDPHEWEIMKKHVLWGKEIISTNKNLIDLIPLVELHHERFDGNGYPHGLKEDKIPKLARILCIIDSFDAMTTERPYQATKTFTEAIQELRTCAGQQFDPQYVEPFINMIQKAYALQLEMEQITV